MATTIPQKFNIFRYHQNLICGYIMMSRIYSRHWKISTGRHFQNGCHNTTQIKHCLFSTTFHMWVDYDVPKLIPDIEKFLPVAIFKMTATIPQKIKFRICHNAKCSFKPVVSGRFGRLHNRILLLRILQWNLSKLNFLGISFCVLRIDKCSVYTGWISKDFLHRNFIYCLVYTGLRFIQGSV